VLDLSIGAAERPWLPFSLSPARKRGSRPYRQLYNRPPLQLLIFFFIQQHPTTQPATAALAQQLNYTNSLPHLQYTYTNTHHTTHNPAVAMASTTPASNVPTINITTSDGVNMKVERPVAERSILIKNLLEDLGGESEEHIPIPNVCPHLLTRALRNSH
jgi:hypothetical protein